MPPFNIRWKNNGGNALSLLGFFRSADGETPYMILTIPLQQGMNMLKYKSRKEGDEMGSGSIGFMGLWALQRSTQQRKRVVKSCWY